jgi:uncharacterized membrane protein/protein-disulfide isomerase
VETSQSTHVLSFLRIQRRADQIQPLPFAYYFWTLVILTGLGLSNALYLSVSHYRLYTDIGYASICAISKSINCDTVSQSPYAVFAGMPVPLWGVLGYAFFLAWLPFAGNRQAGKQRLWHFLLLIALAFAGVSVALAFISTFYIKSYCLLCIASYATNLALVFSCWIIIRRFGRFELRSGLRQDIQFLWAARKRSFPVLFFFLVVTVGLNITMPHYWLLSLGALNPQVSTGLTAEGHPWIGAQDPKVTITEFTDYQCFQCKKMHYYLRQLVNEYPDRIRLVHRHFPMDHEFNPLVVDPFHVGSGSMALLATVAASLDKFWEANDYLFQLADSGTDISIKEMARSIGVNAQELSRLRYDRKVQAQLWQDIEGGLKRKVHGTPAYVIENELHHGQIPSNILKTIILP